MKYFGTYDYHNSGCLYEGEMENGVAEGKGTLFFPGKYGTPLYVGYFHKGKRHGEGILFLEDGKTKCYEGEWNQDSIEGTGIMFWGDGVTPSYKGTFKNGNCEGYGIVFNQDGKVGYAGEFHESEFHGNGTVFRDGEKLFEGIFSFGMMTYGAIFHNGLKVYDGMLPPTAEGIVNENVPINRRKEISDFVLACYIHNLKGLQKTN